MQANSLELYSVAYLLHPADRSPVGWLRALYLSIVGCAFPISGPRLAAAVSQTSSSPTSISLPIPHRLFRRTDFPSTLRGIDKLLHSFDVHLRLHLKCSNGPLDLFNPSPSRLPAKSTAVFRTSAHVSSEASASSCRLLVSSICRSLNQMATTRI
jgi:hypothetical protein